ncbi:MAG: arsenate reductase (azurin) large subunit [Deltaproteobacteria bacterium]|nr:arsenate reductase (azurin) large subunit [Deltaproteobacteria bacterium]
MMSKGPFFVPGDSVPIPPKDAEVFTTACDYCIVACGYKVYRWPVGKDGTPEDNAYGRKYPFAVDKGGWVSPNQHNVVEASGQKLNVVVVPDADSTVVNVGGNHSIRGGCLAMKCYNPESPTADRLKVPMLRVGGKLERISWDDAFAIFAEVSHHVIAEHGAHAWAMKRHSYQFFENTYAESKLALVSIGTPAYADHDNPSLAPPVAGLEDSGFEPFAPSYEDYYLADTLFISGTDPFETKTVLFTSWIMRAVAEHRQKLIYVNPRKTTGAAFAEANGGLYLPITPGTDTILHLALARIILENGWEDSDWIKAHVGNLWESNSGFGRGTRNTDWQWRTTWDTLQTKGFDDYKAWVLAQKESALDTAASATGLDPDDIRRCAEMLAKPALGGKRTKTSFAIEKGLYWSNNYLNTASVAGLAILCGAGNRPGQIVGRMGGHQRGGMSAGSYPVERSPEKYAGRRRKTLDLDRWTEAGHVRFAYIIGTTWIQAMAGSGGLATKLRSQVRENPNQVKSKDRNAAIAALKARVDSGGMVLVHQDIYPREPIGTELADLVLPAATWGEDDFTRCNGERRLRLYSKFYDPPGEAKPDWWIVGQIGKRMGFDGYGWETSNQVFEESGRFSRGGVLDYYPVVWLAKKQGKKAHELLRGYGTTGIQTPIRVEGGKLVGTKRLHDSTLKLPVSGPEGPTVWTKKLTEFGTHSGKVLLLKSPWSLFADFYDWYKPRDGEMWITNGRINEVWQSMFDDSLRRDYIKQRFPENFIEINPDDAARLGIESGDQVKVSCDRVPVQTGGFVGVKSKDLSFTELMKNGHIRLDRAEVDAVAVVMPVPRKGVAFMYFLDPRAAANSLTPRVPDPMTDNYRFKLGVGRITKIGESPHKHSFAQMTFKSREII